ncbi:MAG TPA: AsmA-like C-terminal region-containing protein [Gemmatimonadales bacterium]
MTRRNRLLAIAGGLVVLVLALLVILPLLFQDRIARRVKAEVNQSLNARVDWQDAGLGLIRNFPNLTLTLDGLTTTGVDRFAGDTLAAVRHLRVVIDLASAVKNALGGSDPIVVRAVELDQPRVRLIALEDGTANWDITKQAAATPETKAAKPVSINLRRFEIEDGAISLDNRKANLQASLVGYDQTLSGDFSQNLVGVKTKAEADTVNVTFAGIPYLTRVQLALDADARADLAKKIYTLRDTELRLNDLRLGVSGSASNAGDNLGLDLAFKAPSTNFRSILSLVPAVYAHDFDKVKTSGSFTVNGRVKGEYGETAFPSFALDARVDDAAFQYSDLPLPARNIILDLSLTNPGGSADSTVVDLRKFHVIIGRNPLNASLVVRTPVSDPAVNAQVAGKVDLADVRRTVKLEGVDQLAGTVAANASLRTRMSDIKHKRYGQVAASGTVGVAGLTVKGEVLPKPLTISQASLQLAPERAELRAFKGTVGSSDLEATGSLQNLLSFVMQNDTLHGTASVRSNHFDLDEWRSGGGELEIIPVPPRIDFALDATVAELTYDKLKMSNAHGKLRVKDRRVTLENFQMNTLGGQIALNGYYETVDTTKPAFDVGFRMMKVDIPSAFEAFATVQALAPVAKYAIGKVSTDLHVNGALGKNMLPLFPGLTGGGTLQTTQLELHDFPALEKVVDVTKLQFLDNPTMQALRAAFQIREGRLFMQPFTVNVAGTTMTVSGSNGLDRSVAYTLGLKVPRSLMGSAANQAIAGLVSKAGAAGLDVSAAPTVPLGIEIGGTVTSPTVSVDVGSVASSVKEGAEQAVKQAVTQKVDTVAQRLVAEAEQKAGAIRREGDSLAAKVKREGYQQADALTAKASNPLLKAAAEPAANQLRKEADNKAADIVREAGRRADSLVAAARRQTK